jgi:hypothetical protein
MRRCGWTSTNSTSVARPEVLNLLFLLGACAPSEREAAVRIDARLVPQNPSVLSLKIDPRHVTLAPGEQRQLRVLVKWSDGATIVPALIWAAESGSISGRGLYTAPARAGISRVTVALESGALADTLMVTIAASAVPEPRVPPSAPSRPNSSGRFHEPDGFERITSRDFASKAQTDADRGPTGSQGWDGAEYRYRNVRVESQADAPLSPPWVMRFTYPAGRVPQRGSLSPGVVQTLSFRNEIHGRRQMRKIYLRTAFRVSPNFQGHPTGTNKLIFIRADGNVRCEPIIRLRGSGNGPLVLNVDLQGSPRDTRNRANSSLNPNGPAGSAASNVTRGQWHLLEAVLEMGNNGASNGRLRVYLDGRLSHEYNDIEYEPRADHTSYWDHLHVSPVWGGQGGTVTQEMFLEFDEFYLSGDR